MYCLIVPIGRLVSKIVHIWFKKAQDIFLGITGNQN